MSGRHRRSAAWPSVTVSAAAAVLAGGLVAGAVWGTSARQIAAPRASGQLPHAGARTRTGDVALTGSRVHVGAAVQPAASPAEGAAGVPTSIRLAALHVTAPIVPVSAAGQQLHVPPSITEVGWWSAGGVPGSAAGTSVLDGHVDSAVAGLGALWPLRLARPGQQVTVGLAGGARIGYRIAAVRTYTKGQLPAALFAGAGGPPELVIITCTGPFDPATGHYNDNLVVYAVPD